MYLCRALSRAHTSLCKQQHHESVFHISPTHYRSMVRLELVSIGFFGSSSNSQFFPMESICGVQLHRPPENEHSRYRRQSHAWRIQPRCCHPIFACASVRAPRQHWLRPVRGTIYLLREPGRATRRAVSSLTPYLYRESGSSLINPYCRDPQFPLLCYWGGPKHGLFPSFESLINHLKTDHIDPQYQAQPNQA
jgi:hypothetical protein